MIAYRDFRPADPGIFPGLVGIRPDYPFAVDEMNNWIDREAIDVISVETLGKSGRALEVSTFRVWFRLDPRRKLDPIPEV